MIKIISECSQVHPQETIYLYTNRRHVFWWFFFTTFFLILVIRLDLIPRFFTMTRAGGSCVRGSWELRGDVPEILLAWKDPLNARHLTGTCRVCPHCARINESSSKTLKPHEWGCRGDATSLEKTNSKRLYSLLTKPSLWSYNVKKFRLWQTTDLCCGGLFHCWLNVNHHSLHNRGFCALSLAEDKLTGAVKLHWTLCYVARQCGKAPIRRLVKDIWTVQASIIITSGI